MLNKIDQSNLLLVDNLKKQYKEVFPNSKVIEISALNDVNVDLLLENIIAVLPEGPQYFPQDVITDHPETFIVSEIIRERQGMIMLEYREVSPLPEYYLN